MADFLSWEFALDFSANDAAALIVGIDPRDSDIDQSRTYVVLDRMENDYLLALKEASADGFGSPGSDGFSATALPCVELVRLVDSVENDRIYPIVDGVIPLDTWLKAKRQNKFQNQQFSRDALIAWLRSTGLTSIYPFDTTLQAAAQSSAATRWPWGDHHTELLGHLDAAARKFWNGYKPADPKRTAPKSTEVISWLVEERKVSKSQASAMATLLRADGLKTGPRNSY